MRFYKSKTFLVMLTVAVVLVAVPLVMSVMGLTAPLKNAVATVVTPIQWCADKVATAASGFVAYFTEFDALQEENAQLREQLAAAQDRLHHAAAVEEENAFLREQLSLPQMESKLSLLDATLIGRGAGNASAVYTLDRGSIHGVEAGMPVITADGVVGSISEVGINWCRVTSILEINASAGAFDLRSGALGVAEGTYELREQGLFRLAYLELDADVAIGDRIVTSGYGSVYPQGLTLGTVIELRSDDYAREKIAIVTPAVDPTRLSRVMIVTDCTITPADPATDAVGDPLETEGGETDAE